MASVVGSASLAARRSERQLDAPQSLHAFCICKKIAIARYAAANRGMTDTSVTAEALAAGPCDADHRLPFPFWNRLPDNLLGDEAAPSTPV